MLNYVPYSRNNKLLTIPFEDKQLLLSTEIGGTVQITSFINHALQLLQSGKDALQTSRQKQQWKDAVLMFNESIIRDRKSTRLNSSHVAISYAVFCLKNTEMTE